MEKIVFKNFEHFFSVYEEYVGFVNPRLAETGLVFEKLVHSISMGESIKVRIYSNKKTRGVS